MHSSRQESKRERLLFLWQYPFPPFLFIQHFCLTGRGCLTATCPSYRSPAPRIFDGAVARSRSRSRLLFLHLLAWAAERARAAGPVLGALGCDAAALLLLPVLRGHSPRPGHAGERTRGRLEPLLLGRRRGVSKKQIA